MGARTQQRRAHGKPFNAAVEAQEALRPVDTVLMFSTKRVRLLPEGRPMAVRHRMGSLSHDTKTAADGFMTLDSDPVLRKVVVKLHTFTRHTLIFRTTSFIWTQGGPPSSRPRTTSFHERVLLQPSAAGSGLQDPAALPAQGRSPGSIPDGASGLRSPCALGGPRNWVCASGFPSSTQGQRIEKGFVVLHNQHTRKSNLIYTELFRARISG